MQQTELRDGDWTLAIVLYVMAIESDLVHYALGKASEIARRLSLAGIAVKLVFTPGTDLTPSIDQHLLRAAALSFDFLQYLVGTTI